MATARELHVAIGLLLGKLKDQHAYLRAEHQEIFIPGPPPSELTREELKLLDSYGVMWGSTQEWHCLV
jgi:hypothetical protein